MTTSTKNKVLCPACAGFGHFQGGTVCATCKGFGLVTQAASAKYLASVTPEQVEAEEKRLAETEKATVPPKRAGSNASKGAKRRARKAANTSARKTAASGAKAGE